MRSVTVVGIFAIAFSSTSLLAQRPSVDAERATQAYQRGWEQFHKEKFAEAEQSFKQAINFDGKFALAYYALGRADMAQKKFVDAIRAYVTCRDIYLALFGEQFSNQLQARQRRVDQILEYQMALRQAQLSPQANTSSGRLYQQQLQRSIMRMQQANDQNTVSLEATVPYFIPMALGAAYFRSERFVDAEREYKAALEANPNSGETHNNLAVLYLTLGKFDDCGREISLAEKTGFQVNPGLKEELKSKSGR
jgi:tetratricopeptide (TPR) repeat protein